MTMRPVAYEVGDTRIVAVFDWVGEVPDARRLLPGTTRADWERHRDLLVDGRMWDPVTDRRAVSVFSWVVQTDGLTVVIDTGAGNHKDRPGSPLFHGLSTDYLNDLARAGVLPGDVDVVVNTHLHADHVGWNTRRAGERWVPTFPNARYVLPAPDVEFWDPSRGHAARLGEANKNVFADSVRPVLDSGQAEIWSDTHRIGRRMTLRAAPGHTPGSSVLTLDCGATAALFVGDLLHSPLQVVDPGWASCFDEDDAAAQASRRRVLAHAAQSGALVLPAHLAGARGMRVAAAATGFRVDSWYPREADDARG
jgi:glyoxylase-like metal-dependent hydrolase (beta-lactamase superfamily II)